MRREAGGLPERRADVKPAEAEEIREVLEADRFIQSVLHIFCYAAHLPRPEAVQALLSRA